MKAHLKNRQGWVKTIDQNGLAPYITIPEKISGVVENSSSSYGETIVWRDFRLVMEAQVRDYRTNESVTEAWYEET